MANYDPICEWVLRQEDATLSAQTVDLHDGGALTRLGITSRNNPTAVRDGFYEMGRTDAVDYAKSYYKHVYWFPIRGDEINSDTVAAPFFSFAVNDWMPQAIKELQRAAGVHDDGIMGTQTLAAVNGADPDQLAQALMDQQAAFYRAIAPTHPVVARDLNGLLRRAGRKYPSLN